MPNQILEEYFSNYPNFDYNPDAAPTSEFNRMCDEFGWIRRGHSSAREPTPEERRLQKCRAEAHRLFKDALTKQFNANFGTDYNSLESWQDLCRRIDVNPPPSKLKECRQIVMSTHVNLIDLVHIGNVVTFPTVQALSDYTIEEEKFFPRDNIHAGDLLKHLLRHINRPSLDDNRPGNQGRRGRGRRGRGGRGQGSGRGRGRGTA
ncbi:hypothetical protein CPC08DRAFT_727758 [Agrocybe pediades]|nr:hypothetical protein CPC08DRAFT_727758 [Agrocybe pediades]